MYNRVQTLISSMCGALHQVVYSYTTYPTTYVPNITYYCTICTLYFYKCYLQDGGPTYYLGAPSAHAPPPGEHTCTTNILEIYSIKCAVHYHFFETL